VSVSILYNIIITVIEAFGARPSILPKVWPAHDHQETASSAMLFLVGAAIADGVAVYH
jgi:hypothetical protein